MLTRTQRASTVRNNQQFFGVYKDLQAQEFLHFLLERYKQDGIKELDRSNLSELIKLKKMDTSEVKLMPLINRHQLISIFGSPGKLIEAFIKLQKELYRAS